MGHFIIHENFGKSGEMAWHATFTRVYFGSKKNIIIVVGKSFLW